MYYHGKQSRRVLLWACIREELGLFCDRHLQEVLVDLGPEACSTRAQCGEGGRRARVGHGADVVDEA
jgi:hypothetical protein